MNELLHMYRCSFCQTTATTTIKPQPGGAPPIQCVLCLRIMGFLYSSEIGAEEWAERHRKPTEFRSPYEVAVIAPADREKKCSRRGCHEWRKKADMLNGRFCSEACEAIDSMEMEALQERIHQRNLAMPWLAKSPQKEAV